MKLPSPADVQQAHHPHLGLYRAKYLIPLLASQLLCKVLENRNAVAGVISLGLAITQLPVAKAGAIFHVNRYKGKFHGLMHATTPNG